MNSILQILTKNHVFFFFVILELILLSHLSSKDFVIESNFQKLSTAVSGFVFSKEKKIKDFFALKKINEQLLNKNYNLFIENQKLKKIYSSNKENYLCDIIQAKIVKNTWNKNQNYLVINQGSLHGVSTQMGAVNNNNLIGITATVNNNFSTVISLLNTDLMISAKIAKSGHYGSISWNGLDYTKMQLSDISKNAMVEIGDTIVTSGYSNIFPEGINIGTVSKCKNEKNTNFLNIEVNLFTDFASIEFVYLIEHNLKEERSIIEKSL